MTDTPVQRRRLVPHVWLILTAIIVVITYLAMTWALRKGFDITDEAWVYSLIASNRVAVGEAWGFQYFLHPIFLATGQSILVFRVMRLLGYIALSFALVAFLKAIVERFGYTLLRSQWWFILAATQAGTFFAFAYPPRYISYNELSSWFSQLGVAIMLFLLTQRFPAIGRRARTHTLWICWIALGVLISLLTVSKITSGVLFAVAALVVLLMPGTGLPLWKRIVAGFSGLVGMLLVLALCRYPFGDYVSNLWSLAFNSSAQSAYDHPLGGLLDVYRLSLVTSFDTALPAIILFAIAAGLLTARVVRGLRKLSTPPVVSRLTVVAVILALAAVFALPEQGPFANLGVLAVYVGIASLIVFAAGLYPAEASERQRRGNAVTITIGALLAIATPFIGAFGTNNAIAGQLLYGVTLWVALFALGLAILVNRLLMLGTSLWMAPAALLFSFVLMLSFAIAGDITTHPYRNVPYAQQGTSTKARFLQGIHLTATEAEWADWLTNEADTLHAKDVPTVALSSPGGLLLFNNSSFASPWVNTFWPVSFNSIKVACDAQHPSDLFVLQPGTVPTNSTTAQGAISALRSCGVEFPKDFRVVADHPSGDPDYDMKIWRLKDPR